VEILLTPQNLLGGAVLFVVATFLFMIWGVTSQRKAIKGQQRGLSHVEAGLALSRHALELEERSIALAEESIRNQREMIELLRQVANRRWMDQSDSG
jgi:hypothetical protein